MSNEESATYRNAIGWLYDRIDYERLGKSGSNYRFTLDRMRSLIERLGHGDRLADRPTGETVSGTGSSSTSDSGSPRVVHIAGTKGKGSVATMTAAMLTAGGFKTGLYTSPHLVDLEERFRVDGIAASRDQMIDLIHTFQPIVDAMSAEAIGGPSFFELTTAIAIEHFHRCGCQYWVLETGLGGRLDSTNVFQSDVTIITSIGLDHQHVLGDTVDKIAKEKAGIFKLGVPAVSGVTASPARDVIRDRARQTSASLFELDRDFRITNELPSSWGSQFTIVTAGGSTSVGTTTAGDILVRLHLEGRHQVTNAALAIVGLTRIGITPTPSMVEALATLKIDARLERFDRVDGTIVILDAAHNPDSIAAMSNSIRHRFADREIICVFGTSVDKDAAEMLDQLRQCVGSIILTRYHRNPRFVPVDTLAAMAGEGWSSVNENPIAACEQAIRTAGPDGVVIVCGSFFLAAEVRPWLCLGVARTCV